MTTLLDANVLIALLDTDHVHHDAAEKWLAQSTDRFATCPITEGSLIRFTVQRGQSVDWAQTILNKLFNNPRHEFWPNDVSYRDVQMRGVIGHRQVTDAYLAELARTHSARLATFDQGLAKLHTDVADLVPTDTGR
ncbi:MAG TPA: TA system VapC family ribonuclease toxin [Pseudonocardiaceae bacterium]|nr:TA system VapC family ribonuclease toxin [Pseudonocardiaceae bacterium]